MQPRVRLIPAILLLAMAALPAAQTDNHGIHAVPPPGAVAIDGDLADWDLSGSVLMCYDLDTLRDVYSAQVATMYDAQALYVALRWKDATPMGNSHDPKFQGDKGWAGDCVQLRLKTDRISHVTAWYHAAGKQPAIAIDYGKDDQPFGGGSLRLTHGSGWAFEEGAEMAFKADADGGGYVQEIKLPWKLITSSGKPVQAGERMSCGVELLWGEADWPVHRYADNLADGESGREFFFTNVKGWGALILEDHGKLQLPVPAYLQPAVAEVAQGPVAVTYTLPKEALVTVAIDDAAGKRVRNLIAAQRRPAGASVERWDGLDDAGRPVPAGSYRVKGLYHDGIHAAYTMSFANPGDPTWDTPDGRGAFYSDHAMPMAVAAAGDVVALGTPMAEAGKHLIGCTIEGKRLWGLANRGSFSGRTIALATDGTILYVASAERADEAKYGRGGRYIIWRCEAMTGRYAPWKRVDAQGQPELDLEIGGNGSENCAGIALREGVLAVPLAVERRVLLLDAATGDRRAEFKDLPGGIAGVAWLGDGKLALAAGASLLSLDPATGAIATLATGLVAPAGVAVDAQGRIFVSQRGDRHTVAVFAADGKWLREIGRPGGRPAHGAFIDQAMRNPGRLAIDPRGRLWVPEETYNPKRTSVWDADGKLLFDLVGTTGYASAGAIDPLDPTMGFSDDTVYRLDLAKGTWRPVWSLASRGPDDLFPAGADSHLRFLAHGGRTYVFGTGSARGSTRVTCMQFDGTSWRSAARVGLVPPKGAELNAEWTPFASPLFAGHAGEAFAWADEDGDGLVQAGELHFAGGSLDLASSYWGQLPDDQGTVIYSARGKTQRLVRLPIAGWTPAGAPRYDLAKPVIQDADLPWNGGEGMAYGGSDGRVYINRDPLVGFDRDGKVLFTYPNKVLGVHGSHEATAARPGYLIGPSSILGTAKTDGEGGEVFLLNGNLGQNFIFTWDGLWVQSLFKDTRGAFTMPERAVRGESFDNTTAGGESFGGHFFRAPTGAYYLTLGCTDARVLEVTGLGSLHRFASTLEYTRAQHAAAQEQLANRGKDASAGPAQVRVARVATPPAIDGAPDFPELLDDQVPAVRIEEDANQRFARIATRWDQDNLYVAWRIFGHDHLRNAGQEDRLLFKTGDCVDLMVGPQGGEGVGDLRLLIAPLGKELVAMVYRPVVPGAPASAKVPFSSPWRTITFDEVKRLTTVRVASAPIRGGCLVEAAIPWSVIGQAPKPGLVLRADFGVLAADEGGTLTVARRYWSNKSTGLVNDVPGEAELTPKLWGTMTLE